MAIDTVRDVLSAVPGATPTSTFRDPATNRRVGGAANSFHTRGTPDNPRAVDLVPAGGESMEQLEARLRSSGVNTVELINEGDHIHVAVDGQPRAQGVPGQQPGYRVESSEDLAPGEAQRLLASGEYQVDPNDPTKIFRVVGYDDAPMLPAPLDNAYAERQADRESLALDQEEAQIVQAAMVPQGVLDGAGAVARDVAQGVGLEMGTAVLSGVKRGFNATMDLIDETGDWIETHVPGTIMWEGIDGDASTPMSIRLTTQNDAERRMTEARGGDQPNWLQRLGMGQLRAPVSEAERPESVTGRLIEGVSQFATGFVGGGRALQAWKTAGTAGRVGKNLVQGALADFTAFDGQEERLSNLLAEYAPEALAPALNWLAASPDDSEVEGRFKNAIEGGILGGAVDVLGVGIRRLKAAREVRTAARDAARAEGLQVDPTIAMDEAAARGVEVQAAVREALGNPEGPRFRVAAEADAPVITPFQTKIDAADAPVTPRDITASTDNVFDINLARINTPEDVQAVIVGMADRMAKDVDLARRGTRSWNQTREAANGVDWVSAMGARQPGGAVNAETAVAYRLALNSSATKLDELAAAVEANPTVANQFALRRAASVHSAIQNEFFGARAEAGRALNAFKIPADAPATYLRQVDQLIADMGGANSALDLARAIRQAKQSGDIELNEMLRGGGAMARSREILKLVWTNGKLSALGTPIWNVLGNASLLGLNVATRAVAPRFAGAFGGKSVTQVGEAAALVHGYQQAFRDMFRLNPMQAAQRIGDNAGEAMRREGVFRGMAPGIDDAAPDNIMLRAEREDAGSNSGRPIAAAAWRVNEDSVLGRTLDIIQMIVEAPSNINALSDDFFKVVSARGELHAQAFRKVAQAGVEGEEARRLYAELMLNPTDDMLAAAEREMHELTLTRDIGPRDHAGQRETAGKTTAQSLLDLRSSWDSAGPIPFGSLIFPFVKTPANLISLGMRYSPLAPLSRRFRNDILAGGARAETAKAQIAVGTALWSVWLGMAMDGNLTGGGPGNRAQREAMQRVDEYGGTVFQPYSVRVGDRWISYERGDPIAQGMTLMADMADLIKNGDWDNEQNGEIDEISSHVVMSLGQAFFTKTMLSGASEITAALLDGKVADAERLLKSQTAGMVPFSGALRTARRADDVYMRETSNVIHGLMNITPGLSDDLPVQRDLWGRERRYYSEAPTEAVMNVIGFQSRGQGGSAIDLEILNNGVSVAMPSRSISVAGETVSLKNRPDIYSEFMRLAGEPAFEQLNAVAEGRHPDSEFYFSLSDGPDGGKADYIRDVVSAYRDEARAAVTEMFANDLQAMAADKVRRREDARAVE